MSYQPINMILWKGRQLDGVARVRVGVHDPGITEVEMTPLNSNF